MRGPILLALAAAVTLAPTLADARGGRIRFSAVRSHSVSTPAIHPVSVRPTQAAPALRATRLRPPGVVVIAPSGAAPSAEPASGMASEPTAAGSTGSIGREGQGAAAANTDKPVWCPTGRRAGAGEGFCIIN